MPVIIHSRVRGLTLAIVGLVLSAALAVLVKESPLFADVPWPTPPPGPEARPPVVIDPANVKAVQVPEVAGAASWVILPLSAPIPRFPPVPSSRIESPDGFRLTSDAGSIDSTAQLLYTPIPPDEGPASTKYQEVQKLFELKTFDHRANRTTLVLHRPWVLELPVRAPYGDPTRLVIARHSKEQGWQPLVTSYHRSRGVLQARVLELGLFAILFEPRVVSG